MYDSIIYSDHGMDVMSDYSRLISCSDHCRAMRGLMQGCVPLIRINIIAQRI